MRHTIRSHFWQGITLVFSLLLLHHFQMVQGATTKKDAEDAANQESANNWSAAEKRIKQENEQFKKLSQESLVMLAKEKLTLTHNHQALKTKVERQETELEKLRQQFNKLLRLEEQLLAEIETENQEIKTLEGTIRASSKEADSLIRENPTSFESPGRSDPVTTLLQPNHYPSLEEIVGLADLYFDEMTLSSQVSKRTGTYINKYGTIANGEILRIGTFTTYYRSNSGEELGFLKPDANSQYLTAMPQKAPGNVQRSVKAYLDGKSSSLPVDLSRGAIFQLLTKEKGLAETIKSGGAIAWLILVIGIIALFIALERLYHLVRSKPASSKQFAGLMACVEEGDLDACRKLCTKHKWIPTYRVLEHVLSFAKSEQTVIENACEEAIMREMPHLERFLSSLGILAAIAPLLGLLGTVTGMINTFQVISAFGTGDPKMMSGGISEALITTQLGLAVAIPIMLLHHYLERRTDKILGDMEEKASSLTVSLMEKNGDSDNTNHMELAN